MKINLFDNDFRHIDFSIPGKKSSHMEWTRDQYKWDGVTVFTNEVMFSKAVDEVNSNKKVGWLLEPRSIKPRIYEHISKVEDKFDYIITHDKKLLSSGPFSKYRFAPVGGCWIAEENYKIFPKDKLVSTIVSPKKHTDGHRLRHVIVDKYRREIDVFGSDYNPIETKEEGLTQYQFSVVVENSSVEGYFTEKLLDCFAVGTIPIYWGCRNIEDFFDPAGILRFDSPQQFNSIMSSLDGSLYNKLLSPAKKNFQLFRQYELTEDWIYENILKDRVTMT